ncbi:YciI family protein [Variovorax sp. GT1P44]|uniref:YciI family protein n=1 Tax=Variovorax sp. GT1P44 TaxID=3443742 RepID=UPI003F48D5C8
MKFMIIRKADKDTEAGMMPTEQLVTDMMKYNEEMIRAGVMFDGMGLQPSVKGARIKFNGGKPTITDGPFAEAKELIAGFTLIQVKSRDEALEWAKRWPPIDGNGNVELELRQVYEAEDFGAEFTPELRKQEELLRERAAARDDPGRPHP